METDRFFTEKRIFKKPIAFRARALSLCFLFLAAAFLLSSHVFAFQPPDPPAALFDRGNAAYQEGDFPAAEKHYRRVLEMGFENGPLYFNLGNACFKQKKLGGAVYYWEKAKLLLPADREVRENIELANLLIVDQIETPEDPFPVRVVTGIRNLLTVTQESRLALGLFLAANVLFFLYAVLKDPGRAVRALIGSLVLGGCAVLLAGSLAWKIYDRDFRRRGIVLEQRVDVLSGPGEGNITVCTIHEGIKVRVHAAANGWYQVSLPNGWNGWLPESSLGIL